MTKNNIFNADSRITTSARHSVLTAKRLKVSIIGMSPAIIRGSRLKGIPLAPLTLKAYAQKRLFKDFGENSERISIDIKTFFIEETSPEEMASLILSDSPDLVAFSVYIWNYQELMQCARIIKDTRGKKVLTICGGPQVSPIAEEVLSQYSFIDAVPYITIPGETVFYSILRSLLSGDGLGSANGIIYRTTSSSICKTPLPPENMDYLTAPSPYLSRELPIKGQGPYVLTMETSRGCPYDCGYCFYGRDTHKVEFHPLERVLDEIDLVYSIPQVKHVFFADADIFLNPKRAEAIVNRVLQHNSADITTEFDSNILHITEKVARLLSTLPNYRFCVAIQSVNPRALKNIGRMRLSREIFEEKWIQLKDWAPDAEFHIDVMLGLPGDDLSGFKETLDFCLSLHPTRIGINYPLYLLPGTRFYDTKDELGIYSNAALPFCVAETKDFPRKDIEKALILSLWLEILTYYYPAIADFFYSRCAGGPKFTYILKLKEWISKIEERLNAAEYCQNIAHLAAESSIKEWGNLKGNLLRRFSEAESGYHIFQAVYDFEKTSPDIRMKQIIVLGIKVFDYIRSKGIDAVEFNYFDYLPKAITNGFDANELRSVFSRVKR